MLRVTEPSAEELLTLYDFLDSNGRNVVCMEEGSETEKPHVHAVVCTQKTNNNFRTQLKKMIPSFKGNEKYSSKVSTDPEAALRYTCKEGNVVHSYGMFDKTPEEYRAAYYDCQAEFARERVNKKRKAYWMDDLVQGFREKGYTYEGNKWEIFRSVYEKIPTPSDFYLISSMRKVERMLDLDEASKLAFYRIGDKI